MYSSALEKSHIAAVHQHQHSDVHLYTALLHSLSRIHRNAFSNSSLGRWEDVYSLHIPRQRILFHPLQAGKQAGLSAVTSVHEATAAACCPPGGPGWLLLSPPHLTLLFPGDR